MKKLYCVTKSMNVLFYSNDDNVSIDAESCAQEQMDDAGGRLDMFSSSHIREITNIQDIPTEWNDPESLPYDPHGDIAICAYDFLVRQDDPEYQEYLRLKGKFNDK